MDDSSSPSEVFDEPANDCPVGVLEPAQQRRASLVAGAAGVVVAALVGVGIALGFAGQPSAPPATKPALSPSSGSVSTTAPAVPSTNRGTDKASPPETQ